MAEPQVICTRESDNILPSVLHKPTNFEKLLQQTSIENQLICSTQRTASNAHVQHLENANKH